MLPLLPVFLASDIEIIKGKESSFVARLLQNQA